MKIQYMLSIMLILLLATSCEKEDERMWFECRENNKNLDQQAIFTQLIGGWKIIATACGECLSPGIKSTNKNVKLVFTVDSTLHVFENGQLIRSSKFTITPNIDYMQTYSVETNPFLDNLYTWGYVAFCEDKVGFITSYRDGVDYFFQRLQNQ